MGKVYKEVGVDINDSYLKDNFNIDYNGEVTEYKNAVIDDIMVNLKIEEFNDNLIIRIEKLVSLKAFLLSKEQGMDINTLIIKIDNIMSMSFEGLNRTDRGIELDSDLYKFFGAANMIIEGSTISDGKRKVEVEINNGIVDFNTIKEKK